MELATFLGDHKIGLTCFMIPAPRWIGEGETFAYVASALDLNRMQAAEDSRPYHPAQTKEINSIVHLSPSPTLFTFTYQMGRTVHS